jgi:hypothetical protein
VRGWNRRVARRPGLRAPRHIGRSGGLHNRKNAAAIRRRHLRASARQVVFRRSAASRALGKSTLGADAIARPDA